jgi:cobaltochelatase CobN
MSRSFVSVVVVDARGTSLACLGQAARALGAGESSWLRIAARCGDDLFDEKRIAACAALIERADAAILILHGGADSIPGFEVLLRAAQGKLLHVQANSGSPEVANLAERLGLDFVSESYRRRFAYLARGGAVNLRNLLCLVGQEMACAAAPEPAEPESLPTEGIHHPGWSGALSDRDGYLAWQRHRLGAEAPVIGIWFHQTHWVNGDVEFVDALSAAVEAKGGIPLPVFHIRRQDADLCNMPLDRLADTFLCQDGKPVIDVLLSLMGFAVALQAPTMKAVLGELDLPVLHLIAANSPRPMWEETLQAVSPVDVSVNAAQPEFDGAVIGTVIACRDDSGADPLTGARLMRRVPVMEQLPGVAAWAMNWARLRRTPAAERKIAILFHQYPPRADCLGSAIGLDTFESVCNLLRCLKAEGHVVDRDYDSGEAMAFEILDKLTNDRRYLPVNEMAKRAIGRVAKARALAWHAARSAKVRAEMDKKWGPAPGVTFCDDGDLLVGGVINGNVFLGMQPPRAKMEDGDVPELQPDGKTIHDPFLPATHHYLAYYRWLREDFGAHAVFHIGTHGTLEWMPGKSLGLSQDCYPEAAIADLPNLYPYIISNPGEGIQAKRRSHAVILDHMIPPQTHAGKTEAMERLDDLLGKAYLAGQQDPAKLPLILDDIWALVGETHLDADLGVSREQADADIHAFLQELHGYLTRVEVSAIGDGLHVFGEPPKGRHFNETMVHLTRLPCGSAPSLWDALAAARGVDAEDLRDHPGEFVAALGKTKGQVVAEIVEDARAAMDDLDGRGWNEAGLSAMVAERFRGAPQVLAAFRHVARTVRPKLLGVTDELLYATRGAMGRFVPPGGSGCPTRGNLDILPTGRNFYSVDPYKIPSPEAWRVGVAQGDALIARYLADEGRVPETVGIILWGTATLRTGGNTWRNSGPDGMRDLGRRQRRVKGWSRPLSSFPSAHRRHHRTAG